MEQNYVNMYRQSNLDRVRHLYVDPVKLCMTAFVYLVLFRIPRSVLGTEPLYEIYYKARTLDLTLTLYTFTLFEIITIILGLWFYILDHKKTMKYLGLLATVVFINVGRLAFNMTNPFAYNSYEMFLTFLTALACGSIILHYYDTKEKLRHFFDLTVAAFFVSQLMFVAVGHGTDGSFGCFGLGGGGLALCYSIYFMINLADDKRGKVQTTLMGVCIVGTLLTGSRTNIVLMLVFTTIYMLFMTPLTSGKKWRYIALLIVGALVIVFAQGVLDNLFSSKKLTSLLSVFDKGLSSYISTDKSAGERMKTFTVAFELIAQNPLGISCSVHDLLKRMFYAGAVTFPHSYLLTYYLTFGVPFAVMYIYFLKLCIMCWKKGNKLRLLALYMLMSTTIYGGVSTTYWNITWMFLAIALMRFELQEKASIEANEEDGSTAHALTGSALPSEVAHV